MKKTLIAALLSLSCISAFAADAPKTNVDPAFAKAQELIQAKNYPAAYQELDRLAKTGNAQALYNLGYLTQTGQGTVKDDKKALKYYQDASAKGYPVASYVLAQSYAVGQLGLSKDEKKVREYLEKSSSQGFDDATVELAVLLFAEGTPASDKLGLQKLDPLVKKDFAPAIHAKALYDITDGLKKKNAATVNQGLNEIQNLAKKGYIPALMAVGNMLTNGNIIDQNLPEAQKIFAELAKNNVPKAKESLEVVNKLIAEKAKAPAKAAAPKK
ncbi:sel1 repeat family protein [Acinetobacter bereziniae]|jgi:TPR repeat protein|uniref:tetratricopeptide repeat protein n=1 Tax=Acinetobacter TaxID=469 RepID=UPI0020764C8E|nr:MULTISPECIES: tetratricopeptide repeat protein [Acinetobacter]MCM8512794.1 sel1 repeat family protein [Acinetobacter bereziniae]MDR3029136.1 sel1 repeat family protein [Acinetobacter sp.]